MIHDQATMKSTITPKSSYTSKGLPNLRMHTKLQNMQSLKTTTLVLLSLLLATSTKCIENVPTNTDLCLTQVCTYEEPVTRYVQFPFLIVNESLSESCGYPGFDLFCDGEFKLQINLPNSGVFSVEEIDYVRQELWLSDPDNCLPRKLISLNDSEFVSSSSPFVPVFEQIYWFYNCSNEFFKSSEDDISPIMCLSGRNYGVFASPTEIIAKGNSSLCDHIGPVRVPVRKRSNDMDSSMELDEDIMLTWAKPRECGECYRRGGKCMFTNSSSLEVGCFNIPRHGMSRSAMFAIVLAFVTPIVCVTICITYFLTKTIRYRRRVNRARLPSLALASAVTPQPERVVQGLDQAILESYPKVVLGESRRLPKPDDNNCPICLGEYLAKETLKSIPDCGHTFHADCIDEWLILNASCPVCRYSPNNTPLNNAC